MIFPTLFISASKTLGVGSKNKQLIFNLISPARHITWSLTSLAGDVINYDEYLIPRGKFLLFIRLALQEKIQQTTL